MSSGEYILALAEIAVLVGATAVCAASLRGHLLPAWRGSAALVATAIIGLSLIVIVSQALGTIGLFREGPLLVVLVGMAAYLGSTLGVRTERSAIGWSRWRSAPAIAAAGLTLAVLGRWAMGTLVHLDEGMWGFDNLWYHMPLAAGFAQDGALTGTHELDPFSLNWLYPANSETLHGIGILLTESDVASPLVNLGWAGLALVSAWALARPYGRSAALVALATVSAVLIAPSLLARQPGQAGNDAPATALLLACAALLVNAFPGTTREGARPDRGALAPVAIAGLAAGLALGTKLNLIVAIGALSVAVVAVARPGSRRPVAGVWTVAALATGGFWYARNLLATGNPLPWLELGPLSLPQPDVLENVHAGVIGVNTDRSLAHYLGDGELWSAYIQPGIETAFGHAWLVLLVVAAAGALAATASKRPILMPLGVCALAGTVAYLFTPMSGGGPDGYPTLVGLNMRWVVPFVALGGALLAAAIPAKPGWHALALLAVAWPFISNLELDETLDHAHFTGALLLAAGVVAAGVVISALWSRGGLTDRALMVGATVLVGAAVFWPQAEEYLDVRLRTVWQSLDLDRSFRWALEADGRRIAIAGTTAAFTQYGYYGEDSSNEVVFVGEERPRGGLVPIETCERWRQALNEGGYDFLVTTPTLNPANEAVPGYAPEADWTATDPAVARVLRQGDVSVFRIRGPLDPSGCKTIEGPFVGLPALLTPASPRGLGAAP